MPRPRTISDAAVREAEDLIARGGGIRRTARMLGVKESSLRARLGQRRAVDDVMDRFLYGRGGMSDDEHEETCGADIGLACTCGNPLQWSEKEDWSRLRAKLWNAVPSLTSADQAKARGIASFPHRLTQTQIRAARALLRKAGQ